MEPARSDGGPGVPPPRIVGNYTIGQQIGAGSFAVVWKAQHRVTGEVVAVKEIATARLNEKLLLSLESEIDILKRTNHPNIIRLLDLVKEPGRMFLVLEFCGGGDLSELIRFKGRVPEDVARYFMRQLGEGLRELRAHNLIHRDLKPQNLLLSHKGNDAVLKIADFGFARSLHPQGLAETLCGSPLYMAPEILMMHKYDAKADLWSVGAILFELVTGRPPFGGANHVQLLRNIERSEPVIPHDVRRQLSDPCLQVLRLLLRRNPVERLSFEELFHHKFLALPTAPSVAPPTSSAATGGTEAPASAQGGANPPAKSTDKVGAATRKDDAAHADRPTPSNGVPHAREAGPSAPLSHSNESAIAGNAEAKARAGQAQPGAGPQPGDVHIVGAPAASKGLQAPRSHAHGSRDASSPGHGVDGRVGDCAAVVAGASANAAVTPATAASPGFSDLAGGALPVRDGVSHVGLRRAAGEGGAHAAYVGTAHPGFVGVPGDGPLGRGGLVGISLDFDKEGRGSSAYVGQNTVDDRGMSMGGTGDRGGMEGGFATGAGDRGARDGGARDEGIEGESALPFASDGGDGSSQMRDGSARGDSSFNAGDGLMTTNMHLGGVTHGRGRHEARQDGLQQGPEGGVVDARHRTKELQGMGDSAGERQSLGAGITPGVTDGMPFGLRAKPGEEMERRAGIRSGTVAGLPVGSAGFSRPTPANAANYFPGGPLPQVPVTVAPLMQPLSLPPVPATIAAGGGGMPPAQPSLASSRESRSSLDSKLEEEYVVVDFEGSPRCSGQNPIPSAHTSSSNGAAAASGAPHKGSPLPISPGLKAVAGVSSRGRNLAQEIVRTGTSLPSYLMSRPYWQTWKRGGGTAAAAATTTAGSASTISESNNSNSKSLGGGASEAANKAGAGGSGTSRASSGFSGGIGDSSGGPGSASESGTSGNHGLFAGPAATGGMSGVAVAPRVMYASPLTSRVDGGGFATVGPFGGVGSNNVPFAGRQDGVDARGVAARAAAPQPGVPEAHRRWSHAGVGDGLSGQCWQLQPPQWQAQGGHLLGGAAGTSLGATNLAHAGLPSVAGVTSSAVATVASMAGGATYGGNSHTPVLGAVPATTSAPGYAGINASMSAGAGAAGINANNSAGDSPLGGLGVGELSEATMAPRAYIGPKLVSAAAAPSSSSPAGIWNIAGVPPKERAHALRHCALVILEVAERKYEVGHRLASLSLFLLGVLVLKSALALLSTPPHAPTKGQRAVSEPEQRAHGAEAGTGPEDADCQVKAASNNDRGDGAVLAADGRSMGISDKASGFTRPSASGKPGCPPRTSSQQPADQQVGANETERPTSNCDNVAPSPASQALSALDSGTTTSGMTAVASPSAAGAAPPGGQAAVASSGEPSAELSLDVVGSLRGGMPSTPPRGGAQDEHPVPGGLGTPMTVPGDSQGMASAGTCTEDPANRDDATGGNVAGTACAGIAMDGKAGAASEAGGKTCMTDAGADAYVAATREFVLFFDRAQTVAETLAAENLPVTPVPGAVEMVFQAALAFGRAAAVEELMMNFVEASRGYAKAEALFYFCHVEAPALPLMPPLVLSPCDCERLQLYAGACRARHAVCEKGGVSPELRV